MPAELEDLALASVRGGRRGGPSADLTLLALVSQGACIKTADLSRGLGGEGFYLEFPHPGELHQYGPCDRPGCSRANMGKVLLPSPNLTRRSGIELNLAELVFHEAGGLVDGCGVRLLGHDGELLSLTLVITERYHDLRGVIAVRHDGQMSHPVALGTMHVGAVAAGADLEPAPDQLAVDVVVDLSEPGIGVSHGESQQLAFHGLHGVVVQINHVELP